MTLRITVLGTGYLGATHAACMAELGFEVLGMDVDESKVAALSDGHIPFYEPDLEPLLRASLEDSGFFGARFRMAASTALLLPRAGFDRRTPLWLTRQRAKK